MPPGDEPVALGFPKAIAHRIDDNHCFSWRGHMGSYCRRRAGKPVCAQTVCWPGDCLGHSLRMVGASGLRLNLFDVLAERVSSSSQDQLGDVVILAGDERPLAKNVGTFQGALDRSVVPLCLCGFCKSWTRAPDQSCLEDDFQQAVDEPLSARRELPFI